MEAWLAKHNPGMMLSYFLGSESKPCAATHIFTSYTELRFLRVALRQSLGAITSAFSAFGSITLRRYLPTGSYPDRAFELNCHARLIPVMFMSFQLAVTNPEQSSLAPNLLLPVG